MSARENILARIRSANKVAKNPDVIGGTAVDRIKAHPSSPLPTLDWENENHFKLRCHELASSLDQIDSLDHLPKAVNRYLNVGEDKVGLTGSYCAIAETGTLVMLSGEDQHATTSLLPETHIAVVSRSRILRTMEEAWELIRNETESVPRQVNFISGPSRTADIEMTLVYGAHGPYRVHVIITE